MSVPFSVPFPPPLLVVFPFSFLSIFPRRSVGVGGGKGKEEDVSLFACRGGGGRLTVAFVICLRLAFPAVVLSP